MNHDRIPTRWTHVAAWCIVTTSCVFADDSQLNSIQSPEPLAAWSFDQLPDDAKRHGQVLVEPAGLESPRYPGFDTDNASLVLRNNGHLRIADTPDQDIFDFDNGDAICVETWVRLNSIGENAYIISKGRGQRSGPGAFNQNWAVRLRKRNSLACPNFLFRSRPSDGKPAAWHRWTGKTGISAGSRWHHIVVQYEFGRPESIAAYVDGKPIKGDWDMDGPTDRAPVVDESDVWIGSTMEGLPNNSLDGCMDDLRVYRGRLPDEVIAGRYRYQPRPMIQPEIPANEVLVEMFGPHGVYKTFPEETDDSRMHWTQDAIGMLRLPYHYDQWGVRDDWTGSAGGSMLVRFWTHLSLEPGQYDLLIRSRGLSQLVIDGKTVLTTPAQRNRGGAHHVVDPLPEVALPSMRPHYMNDHERIAQFQSAGGRHLVRFDVTVGAPQYVARVGETCAAIARSGEMFQLISPSRQYELTDAGWNAFASDFESNLADSDQQRRSVASAQQDEYWQGRHGSAVQRLVPEGRASGRSIDTIIEQRMKHHNDAVAVAPRPTSADHHYWDSVEPLLKQHCERCHGDEGEGSLSIFDREGLLRGGDSETPAIVPGDAMASHLIQRVTAEDEAERMPPDGPPLSEDLVAALRQWITQSAGMPAKPKQCIELEPRIDDYAFLRRATVDVIGMAPGLDAIETYFEDPPQSRRKNLVDRLLSDQRYAGNWVGYWQDVLAENPNLLKPTLNNTGPFRFWIHESLADNKPLDRFATELIMMRGSRWGGGTAGFGLASQNDVPMASKAHIIGNAFLGVEMKCARCHDAPYHNWTQRDLFEMAAMLQRSKIKLPASSTVPASFFEAQARKSLITASLVTDTSIGARWPLEELLDQFESSELQDPDDTREQLAVMITSSRRFAEVMANRIWTILMGTGVVDSVHDWHQAPVRDPELLQHLADQLILSHYDPKALIRHIMLSQAYQRSAASDQATDFFAGPARRRMRAEQVVDSALYAAGITMQTEMLTLDVEGTRPANQFLNFGFPRRAWEFTTLSNERDRPSLAMPRAQAITDVLKAFGWRNARPEPLSERGQEPNLLQPAALANGVFGIWLTRLTDDSELTAMLLRPQSVKQTVDNLFLRFLTRLPTTDERERFVELLKPGFDQRVVASPQATPDRKRFPYVSWSNHLNTEANKIKVEMEALVKQGPPPTRLLADNWRSRAEDAIWALVNSPEMVVIP